MRLFCVDCKYYKEREVISYSIGTMKIKTHQCLRNCAKSLITGKYDTSNLLYCESEREDALRLEHFRCGAKGKYFELKEVK